ncbi:MAG: LemA family protein [Sodaliphilus sp.]
MNKSKSTWIIVGVVAVLALWSISSYNGLVSQEEDVEKYWADVEAQYDRRANLVPNLVNVVKGYAKHEEKVFTEVTEARTKIGQINIDAQNMTDEQIEKFQKAQEQMSGALSKLMAVSEAYPELKANQNFLNLQAQLEGTENRITKAVSDFNGAAKEYNVKVRRFPGSIFAGIFGFETKPHFKAKEGAENAPKVSFD